MIGAKSEFPTINKEWMELIALCEQKQISAKDVMRLAKSHDKPKQLLARIYEEHFREVNKIEKRIDE